MENAVPHPSDCAKPDGKGGAQMSYVMHKRIANVFKRLVEADGFEHVSVSSVMRGSGTRRQTLPGQLRPAALSDQRHAGGSNRKQHRLPALAGHTEAVSLRNRRAQAVLRRMPESEGGRRGGHLRHAPGRPAGADVVVEDQLLQFRDAAERVHKHRISVARDFSPRPTYAILPVPNKDDANWGYA